MPDVVSIALGGGTLVTPTPFKIGPESAGFRITERALVFGGPDLTLTDIGVADGQAEIGDKARVGDIGDELKAAAASWIAGKITDLIDHMKTSAADVAVLAVGGGVFLIPDQLPGVSKVVKVAIAGVANAVGAAMAQVSGEIDRIFQNRTREEAITEARAIADERAIAAGARKDSLTLLDVEDMPLAYIPGNALRVRVRVVGDAL